jgi:hypothetical protein
MNAQPDTSWLVRMSIKVGTAIGRWQRRRAARRDDVLVEKWKVAWAEGSDACRAGIPQDKVPHRRSPRRAAWLAGWQWAERSAHPQANGTAGGPAAPATAGVDAASEAGKSGAPEVRVQSQG